MRIRNMTIADLIAMLQQLPARTPIKYYSWGQNGPSAYKIGEIFNTLGLYYDTERKELVTIPDDDSPSETMIALQEYLKK